MRSESAQPVSDEADEIISKAIAEEAEPGSAGAGGPRLGLWSMLVVTAVVGLSLYANLSTLVRDRANFVYFPPFQRRVDRNDNHHLGAEYFSISGALVSGRGYADPFREQTGPTAWMAPVLSYLLAGLRWIAGNDVETITALFVLLQDLTLIGTGVLLLALTRRTTGQVRLTALLFIAAMLFYFRLCFQFTHDCWLILATLDLLIAGLVWLRPLASTKRMAVGWGVFGGFCALVSPVVGFCWALFALSDGWRPGRRLHFAIAVVMSMATISPWVIRNYIEFGRFIPVKSNLAFELHQSQCVQEGGVLQGGIFGSHPYSNNGVERAEYRADGEIKYLDRKWQLFVESVRANPADFAERIANRFFAATLEYVPFNGYEEVRRPWVNWLARLTHPLPFLALIALVFSAVWHPLHPAQWIVIGVYISYLLPYVIVSYYERYKFPIVVAEVALVAWAFDLVRGWLWSSFGRQRV